jgi:serine/threonine-protein kinase
VPVDYARFASWASDVADGLAAAHALSIVHRDLKPDNVMIGGDDRAVILDFGVATSIGVRSGADKLTREGVILGTLPYMAPEQLTGAPLDGRADLYALGLILAELVTGEVPGSADTYHGVLDRRVIKPRMFKLKEIDPGAPESFAHLVDSLLAPARDDRPASAAEVALIFRAIARELRGEPWPEPVRISGPPRSSAPPPAPPRTDATNLPSSAILEAKDAPPAPRWMWILAGVLLALVVLLGAAWTIAGRREDLVRAASISDAASAEVSPDAAIIPAQAVPPSPPDAAEPMDATPKPTKPDARPAPAKLAPAQEM